MCKEKKELQKNVDYITGLVDKDIKISLKKIVKIGKEDGYSEKALRNAFDYWIRFGDLVVSENMKEQAVP